MLLLMSWCFVWMYFFMVIWYFCWWLVRLVVYGNMRWWSSCCLEIVSVILRWSCCCTVIILCFCLRVVVMWCGMGFVLIMRCVLMVIGGGDVCGFCGDGFCKCVSGWTCMLCMGVVRCGGILCGNWGVMWIRWCDLIFIICYCLDFLLIVSSLVVLSDELCDCNCYVSV